MSTLRIGLISTTINRAIALCDTSIYATWIDGKYKEWDSENQQLQRFENFDVILKELENIENASQNWFEEAKSHLTIKEEQEAFHSKLYDFNIPENIDDFGQSSNQNNKRNSNVIEAGNTRLTKVFKKLRVNSSKSVDIQKNYYKDTTHQPQTGNIDDDDEYNNPNLHSEEQEEFEIPNDGF
ncbi:kinase-like domain-containing protein [Rhizophagus irregularis DAOM 181602=DAOM 197198]|nr:kinase-like domain-containing protein [Rhizophagus irregularis DAOM 181602=DAOM 197198]